MEKHVIPSLGACQLAKLRPLQLQGYYAQKLNAGRLKCEGGLSALSVRHHDRLLNVAFKRSRSLNLISRNPVEDVCRLKVADREIRVRRRWTHIATPCRALQEEAASRVDTAMRKVLQERAS